MGAHEALGNPSKRGSLREFVYGRLKEMILSGQFAPGERITEEHLCELLGTSRTPIREALHKIASEGLIRPLPTRGFKVSGDSRQEMEEVFELRTVLEGYCLAIASRELPDEKFKELEDYILKAEEALSREDVEEVFFWNTKFHDAINETVSNRPMFFKLIADLRKYVLRYRKDTLSYLYGARRSIEGHKKILLALRLRDPEICEKVMREHVREAMEDALEGAWKTP